MSPARNPQMTHSAAALFRGVWRSAAARGTLPREMLLQVAMIDDILAVAIHALPDWALNPDFMAHGCGRGRGPLSARGEDLWREIHRLALDAVQSADPGGMAALILHADAFAGAAWLRAA